MLEIVIEPVELYDENRSMFVQVPGCVLTLEHSLISISKWEARWHIPYLKEDGVRTPEQELDYIKCMVVGKLPSDLVFRALTQEHINKIVEYIQDPHTATTVHNARTSGKREQLTAEILYQRMFENGIPLECQKWHLNRLITMIQVCNHYASGSKKMSKADSARYNAELNAARRAKYNTKG